MSQTTPEEAFAAAQAAMERGDWDGFFACVDRNDVLTVAENSLKNLLIGYEKTAARVTAVCAEHSFPAEAILEVRRIWQRIEESARAIAASHAGGSDATGRAELLAQSLRHKGLVDQAQKLLRDGMNAVPDLPRFTAALERAMRAAVGAGSVSSRLFVAEVLEGVSIAGTKAWATRRTPGGATDDIGFVRRKGLWYIRAFAQRPRPRLEGAKPGR